MEYPELYFFTFFLSIITCVILAQIKGRDTFLWGLAGAFLNLFGVLLCIFVLYIYRPPSDFRRRRITKKILQGLGFSVGSLVLIIPSVVMIGEDSFGARPIGVVGFIPIPGIFIPIVLLGFGGFLLFNGVRVLFGAKNMFE